MNRVFGVIAVLLTFAAAQPAAAHHDTGSNFARISASSLNMRACPSVGCYVVRTLHYNKRVRVHHCRRGWCKVSHRGQTGFVSGRYLHAAHGPRHVTRPYPYHPYRNGRRGRNGNGVTFSFTFTR